MTASPRKTAKRPAVPREALSGQEVATALGISRATWWTHVKDRRAPQPVKIGGSTRWRIGEIRAWLAAGCPKCDADKPGDWRWTPTVFADLTELLEIQQRELARAVARVREVKRHIAQGGPAQVIPVTLAER